MFMTATVRIISKELTIKIPIRSGYFRYQFEAKKWGNKLIADRDHKNATANQYYRSSVITQRFRRAKVYDRYAFSPATPCIYV